MINHVRFLYHATQPTKGTNMSWCNTEELQTIPQCPRTQSRERVSLGEHNKLRVMTNIPLDVPLIYRVSDQTLCFCHWHVFSRYFECGMKGRYGDS